MQAIHEQLEQVAKEYNEAAKSRNNELTTELRAKLNDLRKQAHQGGITHSIAKSGDFFELWIEIHNNTNNRILYNEGNWDVDYGWFESAAVGDIHPGDTAYIHMGGDGLSGISCVANFQLQGDNRLTWFQWWYGPFDGSTKGALMNCASERHNYTIDGRIVRFYVG